MIEHDFAAVDVPLEVIQQWYCASDGTDRGIYYRSLGGGMRPVYLRGGPIAERFKHMMILHETEGAYLTQRKCEEIVGSGGAHVYEYLIQKMSSKSYSLWSDDDKVLGRRGR